MSEQDTRRQLLDHLDALETAASGAVATLARRDSESAYLVTRFQEVYKAHRSNRMRWRSRFSASHSSSDAQASLATDALTLNEVRDRLDELMNAYADGMPLLANSAAVAEFARMMVEISKQRTVVDVWATSEVE